MVYFVFASWILVTVFYNLINAVGAIEPTPPIYRMTVSVRYNKTDGTKVTQACGEHYARTFLNNFILTEYMFQRSCQDGFEERVYVTHSTVARVSLVRSESELNTHLNVSLFSPPLDGTFASTAPLIDRSRRLAKQDILACVNKIHQSLTANPADLVSNYNEHYSSLTGRTIHLLQISADISNLCSSAVMQPQEIRIVSMEWMCPSELDYVYDNITWTCIPKNYLTTLSPRPRITDDNHEIYTTTFNVLDSSTEDPKQPFWSIKVHNVTDNILLSEGDPPFPLTFTLLVNKTALCQDFSKCSINVKITITTSKRSQPKCRSTGDAIPQLVLVEPAEGSSLDHCNLALDVTGDDSAEYSFTRTVYLAPMLDMKYDGTQRRRIQLSLSSQIGGSEGPAERNIVNIPVFIQDNDRKATCKSVNDPHITTFDAYEYNNFYEGEFVLYEHTSFPYKVHVVYQRCSPSIKATCNCAVAIQSGDDVVVIDRCRRENSLDNKFTKLSVDLYLNDDLTPGTSIFEEADGKKYVIYLPNGTYIKVLVSGDLLNVWIVASPRDINNTVGLCGNNDKSRYNDLRLRSGQVQAPIYLQDNERPQPREFCLSWRVELFGRRSLLSGVPRNRALQSPVRYCDCTSGDKYCGYAVDISVCDVIKGDEITSVLVHGAKTPNQQLERRKRSVNDNTIEIVPQDRLSIDTNFTPPAYTWGDWSFSSAQDYCSNYVKNEYKVGQLCSHIPAVDFNQDIQSCIEDIQITNGTSWADSARDSMKEQCIEEVQRNGSLPSDIADAIENAICINDCSGHGKCVNGSCVCDKHWLTADCSITFGVNPFTSELPASGLCDTRYMRCNRVIVYGEHFVKGPNLTCHLQECEVDEAEFGLIRQNNISKEKALFINFNAVECPITTIKPHLISVSNDGFLEHASDPLLFLPFDSACYTCSTNSTSCSKKDNSCRIDGRCYLEGERSPYNDCLICKPFAHELQWTTDSGSNCRSSWWDDIEMPNWFIALAAATSGALIAVLIVLVSYKCCCAHRQPKEESHSNHHESANDDSEALQFNDALLHRNNEISPFSDDEFIDLPFRSPEIEDDYFTHRARNISNSVDNATYF